MSVFGNRKAVYTKADAATISREDRMTRLKFELREHIRFLSDYELLSAEWLRMAESLHQIANVAFMETHLPPSDENPLMQKGKKEAGTLWDQERDELAIRILLEEGKLNLALRVLHKYKNTVRKGLDDVVAAACKKFNTDPVAVLDRCRVFEQSLGVLIRFAMNHIEAVQIMDLPEFMSHCKEILDEVVGSDKKTMTGADAEKMQETLVIHYLHSLSTKLEDVDEDRVMDLMESNTIIPTFIAHMSKHYLWYKVETLEAAAKFLSNAFTSEAFTTDQKRFVPDEDTMKQCVSLKGFFVAELVSSYGLKKKDVQKLLDVLDKYELKVGKATIVPLKPVETSSSDDTKDKEKEKEKKEDKDAAPKK